MAKNTGSIIAALLGGAILGAAVALAFAPKSGEELREDVARMVREKTQHLNRAEVEALVNKVIARVKDYFSDEEIEQTVDQVIEEAKA